VFYRTKFKQRIKDKLVSFKLTSAILILLFPFGNIQAQLTAAEYYINDDPGVGVATAISTPADGVFDENIEEVNLDIPTNGLAEGQHTLYVRFRNANGNWGTPKGIQFTVSSEQPLVFELESAEYYVDTDPGKGNGTAINMPTDGSFDNAIESVSIELTGGDYTLGTHEVFVRFKDVNGRWGEAKGQSFIVSDQAEFIPNLTEAEYFVNTDPGEGMGTPISAPIDGSFGGTNETVSFDISGGDYSLGTHKVFVRFKDANGNWGQPRGQGFIVNDAADFVYTLTNAEYFINTDPGEGNGTAVAAPVDGSFNGKIESFDIEVPINDLPDGPHTVFTRFQGSDGNWGAKRGFQFMVSSAEEEDLTIVGAEYFVNTDPGEGSGTPVTAPVDGAFDEAIEELSATFNVGDLGLSIGRHFAYFRVKGSNGKWGPARGVPFQIEDIAFIDRAEYYFGSDPGEGNGTLISVAKDGNFDSDFEEIELDIPMSETGLSVGQHTMNIRFRNSRGEWSQPSSKNITVEVRPIVVVSTDTLQFGEAVVGDEITRNFTVGNNGDGPLNISNITSSSSEFTISETTGSIPANSENELTFTVTYNPSSAGNKNATLTIANNDRNQTIRLLGSALAKEPIMVLSSTALEFGEVLVGDSVAQQIAVYNTGFDTLTIDNLSLSSSEYKVSPSSGTLAPGNSSTDSLVFNIALVPESDGSKTATLSVAGNITTQQVSLSGTAKLNPEPTISLGNSTLAFGAIEIGTESEKTLQIRNLGTNTLTISSIVATGTSFSIDVSTPIEVVRGTPLNVPVTFAPGTASTFTGSIQVNSNDASNSSVGVILSGEGTLGPPVKLLEVSPDTLDFGLVTKEETSKQVISLTNDGNATLSITGMVSDNSSFFVEDAPNPQNPLLIAGGESANIDISFSPSTGGAQAFSGILSISSDRTIGETVETLSMKGIGVDEPTPSILLSTRRIDFGELKLGNSSSSSFMLTNGGNADLIVSNISSNNSVFKLASSSASSFTLTPNQSQTIDLEFEPTTVTEYASQLTVSSNIDAVIIDLLGSGVTLSAGIDTTTIRTDEVVVSTGQAIPINITPTGIGNSGSVFIYYKSGGPGAISSYTKTQMQRGSTGAYSVSLPASITTANGVSYWYEISDGIETVTSPITSPNFKPYSILVEIPDGVVRNSPQPAGADQNFYRLVSVPLVQTSGSVTTVLENFGEYSPEAWRLFRWQSGKYVEHNENGFETFAPGRGYWFITTKAASIQSGTGKSARTDKPFSIFLQPGWNMIGSPFNYITDWTQATKPSGVENLWMYDGSGFVNSNTFAPWEGYFVNNTTNNPLELKLSAAQLTGSGKEIVSSKYTFDTSEGWFINLETKSGLIKDTYNYLGAQVGASDEKDDLDISDAPKQPGEYLQLSIINKTISDGTYSVDIRKPNFDGHYWDFEINTNTSAEKIDLGLLTQGALPENFKVRILDKDQKTVWDVSTDEASSRVIRSGMGVEMTRKFRAIVGTEEFIMNNDLGIKDLPSTFILKNNYPNPFNPSTTIVFGLPEASNVTLEIYNSIGRKVATLINGTMEAGYHDFIWDASRVASGVYFYRITARGNTSNSTFSNIQRMTLIK
tara:strand:- start:55745 stop:60547 length:4803 start_codon:yes stop_codon:yes gene_type:complete